MIKLATLRDILNISRRTDPSLVGDFLRALADRRGLIGVGIPSGLILAGKNDTEQTTTSTSTVDILTVSGLSIPVTTPFIAMASARKTSGAAAAAEYSFKVNSTTVASDVQWSSTTNQAESGVLIWLFGSRGDGTSYARSGVRIHGGSAAANISIIDTADLPNATITSVTFRGRTQSASVTYGVDEAKVYTLAAS